MVARAGLRRPGRRRARARAGIVASLRAEPYSSRRRAPARADARGPIEAATPAAARDARAARADLPALRRRPTARGPGAPARSRGRRHAALAARRRRRGRGGVRRPAAPDRRRPPSLRDRGRVRRRGRRATALLAVLVSTDDPGLRDLPDAPRVRPGGRTSELDGEPFDAPRRRVAALAARALRHARPLFSCAATARGSFAASRASSTSSSSTAFGHEGIAYTPDRDGGGPPRSTPARPTARSSSARRAIEDVFDHARRGEHDAAEERRTSSRSCSRGSSSTRSTRDRLARVLRGSRRGHRTRCWSRLPTRTEREPVLRLGEGGDDTTAIDAAAEDAVVRRLEALGVDLTLVSEELGVRAFGEAASRRSSSTRSTAPSTQSAGSRSSRSRSRWPTGRRWTTSSSATSTTSARARSGSPSAGRARSSTARRSRAGPEGHHRDPVARGNDDGGDRGRSSRAA